LRVAALAVLAGITTLDYRVAIASPPGCGTGESNAAPPETCNGSQECLNGVCCTTAGNACSSVTCCSTLSFACQDAGPLTIPKCCQQDGQQCRADTDCCSHTFKYSDAGLSADLKQGVCTGISPTTGFGTCSVCTINGNQPDVVGTTQDCCSGVVQPPSYSAILICAAPLVSQCSSASQCQQPPAGDGTAICGGEGTASEGECCLQGEVNTGCDAGSWCCSGVCLFDGGSVGGSGLGGKCLIAPPLCSF
jgi:hypothetical protein